MNTECTITCRCSHVASFDAFTRTAAGIDTPRGVYQCPACGLAWSIRPGGEATIAPSGAIIPPPSVIAEAPKTL